jgi:hypothetical protein
MRSPGLAPWAGTCAVWASFGESGRWRVDESVTIVIDAGLIGQPARPVVRRLRQAGLVPRAEWSPVGHVPAGTVITVRPRGDVEPGTVVIVTVAASQSG